MFHRTFPEIKISATLLQTTYKLCGIFKVTLNIIEVSQCLIDYQLLAAAKSLE